MTLVVTVVTLVVVVATYVTWTAGRIDRMHVRVEAARAALDAQLVRRAAAVTELSAYARVHELLDADVADRLHACARAALEASGAAREGAENDLSRALRTASEQLRSPDDEARRLFGELETAGTRAALARQFHNHAVRDTLALRWRRVPRLLRLGHKLPLPSYVEIDDTELLPLAAATVHGR